MRVLVVGAGVVGLTIAFRLSQRGVDVTVAEKDELGKKASWAGAGILPPSNDRIPSHAIEHIQSLSNQIHPKLSNELSELTGIDNEYTNCGGIYLGRTIGESAALIGTTELWEKEGIAYQWLDSTALQEIEPNLNQNSSSTRAISVPGESQLRNPKHLQALATACQLNKVRLLASSKVENIKSEANLVTSTISGKRYEFDQACIASGAWTSLLTKNLSRVQVIPIKGHMLLYKLQQKLFHHVINEGNRYVVSRSDGHVLVGSSEEESGFDESHSETEIARLKNFASSFSLELNDSNFIRAWTGLRPMAYDMLPFIGRHSNLQNLFFATGHFRSGLALSPGTAHVICKMMLGETLPFDMASLRPER